MKRRLARENPEVLDRIEFPVVSDDDEDGHDYGNFGGDEDEGNEVTNGESKDWWFCVEAWFKDRISDWGSDFDSQEWRL